MPIAQCALNGEPSEQNGTHCEGDLTVPVISKWSCCWCWVSHLVVATLGCSEFTPPHTHTHRLCLCLLVTALAWSERPASAHARTASVGHASKEPDGLTGFICLEFMPLARDEKCEPLRSGSKMRPRGSGVDCSLCKKRKEERCFFWPSIKSKVSPFRACARSLTKASWFSLSPLKGSPWIHNVSLSRAC